MSKKKHRFNPQVISENQKDLLKIVSQITTSSSSKLQDPILKQMIRLSKAVDRKNINTSCHKVQLNTTGNNSRIRLSPSQRYLEDDNIEENMNG